MGRIQEIEVEDDLLEIFDDLTSSHTNSTHGTNCVCMDVYIRRLRNFLEYGVLDDEIRKRFRYILITAANSANCYSKYGTPFKVLEEENEMASVPSEMANCDSCGGSGVITAREFKGQRSP